MPIDDRDRGEIACKIVYYGAAGAGKTTNLERISTLVFGRDAGRLRPSYVGENRVASVEIPLGVLVGEGGPRVRLRLETMQGEVSSGLGGWTETLADADGIVLVVDSSPRARSSSFKSLSAIREKLEGGRRAAPATPTLIQWNKRDLGDARSVAELETELNHACVPSIESAALRGEGVTETLIPMLVRTLAAAHRRAGNPTITEAELRRGITASIERLAQAADVGSLGLFGSTIAPLSVMEPRAQESPPPRYEVIESREALFSAELRDAVTIPLRAQPDAGGERPDPATRMFVALERAARRLNDAASSGWPDGWLAGLLDGCERSRGSLLLFRPEGAEMDARELVPAGSDTIGGAASLCSRAEALVLPSLLVVPLAQGDRSFGGLFIHQAMSERALSAAEQDYWKTAAALATAHLARQSADSRAVAPRQAPPAPGSERAERGE